MRSKEDMLNDINSHAQMLDPQHYELARVAMIETEIQLDIRDLLENLICVLASIEKIAYRAG